MSPVSGGVRRRDVAILLSVLVAVLVATGSYLAWRAARRAVARDLLTAKEEQIDITALVTRVRDLNRLETAAMRVVHVSTITQSYKLVPNTLGGDKMTFFATGDVIAGIDLSQIKPADVWREGDGTIVLRLPPPQILVTRIDNSQSRVLTRDTGLFRRADINLESRIRQHAEAGIRDEAIRKGILDLAAQNGERKLADFLHTVGVTKLRFLEMAAPAVAR